MGRPEHQPHVVALSGEHAAEMVGAAARLHPHNARRHLRRQRDQQREAARQIFYQMKALDVKIAIAEQNALASDPQHGSEEVRQYETSRLQMQAGYNRILQSLETSSPAATEQHRLIAPALSNEAFEATPRGFPLSLRAVGWRPGGERGLSRWRTICGSRSDGRSIWLSWLNRWWIRRRKCRRSRMRWRVHVTLWRSGSAKMPRCARLRGT